MPKIKVVLASEYENPSDRVINLSRVPIKGEEVSGLVVIRVQHLTFEYDAIITLNDKDPLDSGVTL